MLHSLFTVNGDIVTVTTPSDCRWLLVEYQPHRGGDGEHREERRKVKVPATGNMVSQFSATLILLSGCLFFFYSFPKHQAVVNFLCNLSFLQFLCEVKQRAIEELQIQEQSQGKLCGVKHTFFLHGIKSSHLPQH